MAENSTGSFYQAAASDPEGRAISFSIVGGADAARFALNSMGQLSFIGSPNFDLPADADANNVYLVELAASDGQTRTTLTLSVTISNLREGVSARRVGTGFVNPVALSPVSASIILVAEKSGAIYAFNPQNGARQLLIQIDNVGGAGVLAIAAAPDYASVGRFFAMYTTANGLLVVHDFASGSMGPTFPNTFAPLMTFSAPDYAGGGWLGFETNGNLLIATGDAGDAGDPSGSAQNDASRLGKIIRATPNPDPFAGASPIFFLLSTAAKGLHQPNGGFVYSGGLLLPDRGQSVAEEVNLLPPGGSTANFGWPFKEGTRAVKGAPPTGLADPVVEYGRTSGPAIQGIVGGAVAGSAVPSLSGHYVFADQIGAIFSVPVASLRNGTSLTLSSIERRTLDFAPDAGAINQPVAVVADAGGRLYVLDADGDIFRVDAG